MMTESEISTQKTWCFSFMFIREDLIVGVPSGFSGTSGHVYAGYIDFRDDRISAKYCQSKG